MVNNELTHYGTIGMKWGVRRYQNKDGTLTKAGKKRYDKEMTKLKKEAATLRNKQRVKAKLDKLEEQRRKVDTLRGKSASDSDSQKSNSAPKKRTIKDLSDDELRSAINRMQMEKQFKELTEARRDKGKSFVETMINDMVIPSATDIGKQVVKYYMTKGANKMIGATERVKNQETDAWEDVLKEVIYTNNKKK